MDRIYLIDAVNFLFRSYYAIGPMMNDQGQSTSALYGFVRSLLKLKKDFSPDHLVCIFDGPDNKKARKLVYAEYKMNRKGAPEDLFPQFDLAYQYCELAGIPVLCVDGVEADDTMATVALWAEKKGATSFLCTSDKDMMQLVNKNIFVLQPHKDNLLIDEAKVQEIFGVRADQMLDYLAIVGDASDNIPGIAGFGPKTATALLEEFGTLDQILAHPEKVKGEKKQEALRTQKAQALMSRELATLNIQVEVPQDEEFYRVKEPDTEKLIDFFHQMKFSSLLRDLKTAEVEPAAKKSSTSKHDYRLIHNAEELSHLLDYLLKQKEVGIDTETTGVNPYLAELVGIGFSVEPGEAWYVPLNSSLEKTATLQALRAFFASSSSGFYGHNIKYDYHVLKQVGISLKTISFDTLLASYLIDPQNRQHNLDQLTLDKFKKAKIPIESLIGKGKNEISMKEVPPEKVKDYCCEDIDYTTRLKELFEEELKFRKLDSVLHQIEIPLLPILAKMEEVGIYLDGAQLEEQGEGLLADLNRHKEKIYAHIGQEFNLNSPKQLGQILFETMGLKSPSKKKGDLSTAADILEELAIEHPIVKDILEYRMLEKLRSTYVEALPHAINPRTGRIHCTFNQSVAATGRLSCQDPNLQNIPVRSKEGMAIRSCFKPETTGWSFLGADYSQIELRILAHFSRDKELVHAFQTGKDIHVHTASLIFDVPEKEVTSQMRDQAKTVNFGIVYGQSPFGLSKQLQIPVGEAAEFIKKYFKRYPGVLDYLESCREEARKTGMVKTLTGRQRPIPEIANKNPMIRAGAERLAINTPLQGTAADLVKTAMIQIDRDISEKNLQGKMILQIHDELIFEIPDEEISAFQKLVQKRMEQVIELSVPIEVHIAVGKNWGEC
jgi:DNA polymerase-1